MSLQSAYNAVRSQLDRVRETVARPATTSTFRATGTLTAAEFVAAGDYLVYKFPTWAWAAASSPARTVAHLPPDKQFLVTRGIPCRRRLNERFAGDGEEHVVRDGEDFASGGEGGEGGEDEEGWLSTGGQGREERERVSDVRVVGDRGEADEAVEGDDEEEIPDMEDDDDDEAIIREPEDGKKGASLRTYTLYITYSTYYHTPRLYLSGYAAASQPLAPDLMLEDVMGDYKDKTVTLEDFPFFDSPVRMASVHPCRHAAVMKLMLDRADAALRLRKERARKAAATAAVAAGPGAPSGNKGLAEVAQKQEVEGLADRTKDLKLGGNGAGGNGGAASGDEWEVLPHGNDEDDEYAIRVDQYIVVFLKFIASVTPGMEHDFTMGI